MLWISVNVRRCLCILVNIREYSARIQNPRSYYRLCSTSGNRARLWAKFLDYLLVYREISMLKMASKIHWHLWILMEIVDFFDDSWPSPRLALLENRSLWRMDVIHWMNRATFYSYLFHDFPWVRQQRLRVLNDWTCWNQINRSSSLCIGPSN